jgi:hypothetical protein
LSDREYLQVAVAHQAPDMKELRDGKSAERIEAFLAAHPNCCRIGSDPVRNTSIFDELLGKTIWAYVVYELPEERVRRFPSDGSFYRAFFGMNSCGKIIDTTGETLTEDQVRRLQTTR